jgi:hypothetical protein
MKWGSECILKWEPQYIFAPPGAVIVFSLLALTLFPNRASSLKTSDNDPQKGRKP